MNYYNEFKPEAAAMLRQLISDKLIPDGEVDDRSITDIGKGELKGYTQCHFFAGMGGWSAALELAEWEPTRPVWTGSCPCQPFSSSGQQKGTADPRHLWPAWFRLIQEYSPSIIFGEQVAAAIGKNWLDGVYNDLEGEGYAVGSAVLPACSVDAPNRRDRLWFVAHSDSFGSGSRHGGDSEREISEFGRPSYGGGMAYSEGNRREQGNPDLSGSLDRSSTQQGAGFALSGNGFDVADTGRARSKVGLSTQARGCEGQSEIIDNGSRGRFGPWRECEWLIGGDGKARRFKPSIPLLAHGVQGRVALLHAIGNAINPYVAAEFIKASS